MQVFPPLSGQPLSSGQVGQMSEYIITGYVIMPADTGGVLH